jgi:hypothetical protein
LTSFKIATITFIIGLAGYGLIAILVTLLHKVARKYSFSIIERGNEIIIRNSTVINTLNAVGRFFLYSLFTFIIAANSSITKTYFMLIAVYSICLTIVVIGFYNRSKFAVTIDKEKQLLKVNTNEFFLKEFSDFEIFENKLWLASDTNSYGLYIKNAEGKKELIYGYSVFADISQLKNELENRLNKPLTSA